ncbi:MAG: hypothetical protein WC681_11180 [Sterolibacterium sp.]|jgi:hypothetical protein
MIDIEPLIDDWLAAYDEMCRHAPNVLSFDDHGFTFLFDLASPKNPEADDRLVAAYGSSSPAPTRRDAARIRGFLGGGLDTPGKGRYDKGHALAHAIGGGLDANLFPQRPELNRGRSKAGQLYRSMERYAGAHAGTFVYSRLLYGDESWVPCALEYGVQREDGSLWVERFDNT